MSYSLSFSEEFYYANDEGESGELQRNIDGKPFTLHSAVRMMPADDFRGACKAAGIDPYTESAVHDLIEHARRTVDSCATIGVPVEVYLDVDRDFSVKVYEAVPRRKMTYLDDRRVTAFKVTEAPIARTRTGYGSKLPSAYMLQLDGKRWHRVYTICWSNAGTDYVIIGGEPHYLQTGELWDITRRLQASKAG